MNWLSDLGILRSLLLASALACIAAAPFANGQVYVHDWRLFPSVIAPSVMMMLVFAIPLDVCMSRIFMAEAAPAKRAGLRRAILLEIVVLFVMVLAWTPFLLKVVDIWPT